MKTCPYCQVENRDDAQQCHFCGHALNVWAQEDSPEPTQPTRPAGRERPVGDTQPARPPTPPPSDWSPPRPPAFGATGQTTPGQHGAEYSAAEYNAAGYGGAPQPTAPYLPGANSAPPPAPPYDAGRGGYPPYPPGGAQIYAQPYPPRPKPRSDRLWLILAGVLAVLLLCMGTLAVWILTTSAAGGLGRAGAQISTQASGVFNPGGTPAPTDTPVQPSPWPTFTTAPTFTPLPSPIPAETQPPAPEATRESSLEKYLTPECAAALDHLEGLTKAVAGEPGLPLQAQWREELVQTVGEVRTACGSLEQASPVPGIMAEAQQNLDLATQEFDEANRLFKEGVDEFNPGKVLQAGQHLAEATKYLNQALGELRKIGD